MTSAATRMKLLRERTRAGRAIVPVEIDLEPVGEYLIDAELLQIEHAEDRKALGAAIGRLLELLLAERHLRRT